MKSIILFLLSFYQVILSPLMHQFFGVKSACRFEVTCSAYAQKSIRTYGVIKGSSRAMLRFLRCQPLFSI